MRKPGVWITPTVEWSKIARCVASSGQSHSRWREELRSRPHVHGSTVIFGSGSVGDRFENTLHIARVSAQLTPRRWLGNFKEGFARGSLFFQWARNSDRTWVRSQVLVVTANWQGMVEDAPNLASVLARSFPRIPQWEGHHIVVICQPRS